MLSNFSQLQQPQQQQQQQDHQDMLAYNGGGSQADLSPPHNVTSTYWQQQIQLVQLSRQTASPHTYARNAALASRNSNGQQSNGQSQPPSQSTVTELAVELVQKQRAEESSYQNASNSSGGPMTPNKANSGAPNPKLIVIKEQMEEERQRHINEEINKQFWTAIDVSGQGVRTVSPKLFNYHFLQKLYLSHNKLMQLPQAITKLRQLKVLDLSDNYITELPPDMGMVFSLRYLFLFDNKLTSLPYELGTLFHLELLGIEGNPLDDNLKSIMANEGTRGVIIYLRDKAPVGAPGSPREWLTIGDATSSSAASSHASPAATPVSESAASSAVSVASKQEETDEFTFMSYNTLCDGYATPMMYKYTPSWALGWPYRSELLKGEVLTYGSDILCLQEVDGQSFHEFWTPHLKAKGYEGIYLQKSRARTMSEADAKKVDGCATFYKKSLFNLVERQFIEYNSLALKRDDFKKTADIYNRVMNRAEVALVAVFESVQNPGQLVAVANTHIHWDPKYKDVKLVQTGLLMEELEGILGKYASSNMAEGQRYPHYTDIKNIPLVICIDSNSPVNSGVYQLFSQGKIAPKHSDMEGHVYGKFTEEGMFHKFTLKSAYADIGELPFTNFTPDFVEVIDYIFYSTSALNVKGLLGPMDKEYCKHHVGFPNSHHPSDHIPIMTRLALKKPKEIQRPKQAPNFGNMGRK